MRNNHIRLHIQLGNYEESIQHNEDQIRINNNNNDNKQSTSRRDVLKSAALVTSSLSAFSPSAALAAESLSPLVPTPAFTSDVSWPLGKIAFSLLPLAGTSTRRATVEECIVPDTIWTHDQIQGIVNVNVPVRQTVIKLKNHGGGLWIHNPVAPTPQLLKMVKDLEAKHGPVRHIVLGTVALEHKATFGSFCKNFPRATVWIQPGQWAFPIDLSIDYLGVNQRGSRFRELPIPGKDVSKRFQTRKAQPPPEWTDEIEYEVLGPFSFKSVGKFSEAAFYHKSSNSLLVTDTVVSVTRTPPAIIQEDPRGLLFHARDNITEVVEDTPFNREKGWRRMVQFGLVFFPSQIKVDSVGQALSNARQIDPRMSNLGDGAVPLNLYPWSWDGDDDIKNFQAISQQGKLFCPPILTKLILDREPEGTIEWVDRVSSRFSSMKRIIPCHLENNVQASASDFSQAFDVLRSRPGNFKSQRPLAEDLALLQQASDALTQLGIVGPSLVCDGEPARKAGLLSRFTNP